MNQALVDQIAAAVLYEGYLLYPYRPSVKNRQRWTFGGLLPQSYSDACAGSDASSSRTECLVVGDARTALNVRVRFLHLQTRRAGEFDPPWQEAVERTVALPDEELGTLARSRSHDFAFPSRREIEPAHDSVSAIVREQEAIAGSVELAAEPLEERLFKVTVQVHNRTPFEDADRKTRDDALLRGFVSTHAILGVRGGEFVSAIDPPEHWRAHAAGCRNVGTWPVLVGEPGTTDALLSAPIILYDYPQIAPESPGDLFDATEIDEILTLRILTLTDAEKSAMVALDDRARALLERTETLAREQLMGLHGTIRGLRPI